MHIPWCIRKCPYCDFNSHSVRASLPEDEYLKALIQDLEQGLPRIWGRVIDSIFIGGGTPSLFSAEGLDRLLSGLRARLNIQPDAEITLEANPGAAEQSKFNEFRALGINRISVGVQSFDDGFLTKLGRVHGGNEAIKAVEAAHYAGFKELNIDLMFALPGQRINQVLDDVNTAIDMEPSHISFYQLTVEPNTLFAVKPPNLPSHDDSGSMQVSGQAQLDARGYRQYEVSAYARHGSRCRHNLNYWRFGDYLGIGAGAHGKITDMNSQTISRLAKVTQPKEYMAVAGSVSGIATEKLLDDADLGIEFMMNALRMISGFEKQLFEERTGIPIANLQAPLQRAQQLGLLQVTDKHVTPTKKGRQFLNDLLGLFI